MQLRKGRYGKMQSRGKGRGAMAACGAVVWLLMALPSAAQSSPTAPPAEKTQGAALSAANSQAAPPPSGEAVRKKELAEDSARLLQLANDLKAEVDKTNKDILSMSVVRKAEEIERLARAMKEKTKAAGGAQ